MKKLFLSSVVLIAFAISITLFQFSCKKDATAQVSSYTLLPATNSTLGGVIIDGSTIKVDVSGKISTVSNSNQQLNIILYALGYGGGPGYINSNASEYWVMNYDGTNPKKIPLTFSSNLKYGMNPHLSPDCKTVFFTAIEIATSKSYLFSCSRDGSNLKTLLTVPKSSDGSGANIEVAGAY